MAISQLYVVTEAPSLPECGLFDSQWLRPGLTVNEKGQLFSFSALSSLPFSTPQAAFQRCPTCLSALPNVPFCRSFELAWAWRKQTASDTVHAVTALLEVATAKQVAAHDDTKDRFWYVTKRKQMLFLGMRNVSVD